MVSIVVFLIFLNKLFLNTVPKNKQQIIRKASTVINKEEFVLIILLMQIQREQSQCKQLHFDIIYNARTSKASRSRKSSISIVDKNKPRNKNKKNRKMTMNPESIHFQQIRQIEQLHNQHRVPLSEKGDGKEQQLNIDTFLELSPREIQSEHDLQLEQGIFFGIIDERQLDSDFDLSGMQLNAGMDIQMRE